MRFWRDFEPTGSVLFGSHLCHDFVRWAEPLLSRRRRGVIQRFCTRNRTKVPTRRGQSGILYEKTYKRAGVACSSREFVRKNVQNRRCPGAQQGFCTKKRIKPSTSQGQVGILYEKTYKSAGVAWSNQGFWTKKRTKPLTPHHTRNRTHTAPILHQKPHPYCTRTRTARHPHRTVPYP